MGKKNFIEVQFLHLIAERYILHCRLHFHPQDTYSCFSFSLSPNTNGYRTRCYLMRHSYSILMAITNWRNLKRLTLSGLYKKCTIKNVLASICFNKAFRFFTIFIFLLLSIGFFCFFFSLWYFFMVYFRLLLAFLPTVFTLCTSFLCSDFFLLFILFTSSLFHSVNSLLKLTPSHSFLCFFELHCVNVCPSIPPSVPFLPSSSSHSLHPLLT